MTQADTSPGARCGFLLALLLVGCLLLSPLFLLLVSQGGCGSSSLDGPITPPSPGALSAGQMVRWFETQGDSANASAGIVGNLEQESQLNPAEGGGGLAQWKPGRYGQMVTYAASVGLSPTSDQGQLTYRISSTTCARTTAACWQGWTPLRIQGEPRRCSKPRTSCARAWSGTWT